jgi:glycosyltransferase involved in cell wall biosynthesis
MSELAIIVPVLNRPQNVAPLMESIRATTPGARTVFVVDPDDLAERAAILAEGGEFFICAGSYSRKINEAIRGTAESLIVTAADDLHFHPGWLEAAKAKLAEGYEVIGLNDLIPRPVVRATHFLVDRRYVARGQLDGQPSLLHEGYFHNFPDRELVETARQRGVYAYAEDAVVEYLNVINGKAEMDATYAKGQERFRADRRLFRQRSALWT